MAEPEPTPTPEPEPDKVTLELDQDFLGSVPENFKKDGAFQPDSLLKSWTDQSRTIKELQASKGDIVEKPEDYTLDLSGDEALGANAKKVLRPDKESGEDPFVADFRKEAHDLGISKQQFDGVMKWYINRQGPLMDPPIDQAAELQKVGDNAQSRVDYLDKLHETLVTNGTLTEDEAHEFWLTRSSAAGIKLVEKLLKQGGGSINIPGDIKAEDTAANAAELRKKMREIGELRDKNEITPGEANRRMTTLKGEYEKVFGTEVAGTSLVLDEE